MRAVVVVLVLLALTATASACEYVSAWDDRIPSNIPPYEIPMWIRSNFDDLCGYFTEDGYFSTIFELDAFYRWKYPEIYDSRIYDIIYLSDGSVNRTFLEWYWDDQETVRAWLREIWNYPDDWRVIIAVSMKIYYEGGGDIKALDRDVALTPELINEANAQYGRGCVSCAAALDPIVKPTTRINLQLVAGIVPALYDNVAANYEKLFGGLGLAPPAKDFLSSIVDLVKSVIDSVIAFLKSLF